MMNFIVCFLVVLYFSDTQGGGGKGSKHDILKIHVPEIINHKHHTHYVFIHKHAPKKAPKKKEVKHHHHKHIHLPGHGHHHHKHWFGIHKSHGHKHTVGHAKPVITVHKTHKVPKVHAHKSYPHIPHHNKHPVHKTKPASKPHHINVHHQPTYPFTHENIRHSPGPVNPGYQVTEEYDPEEEVYKDFHPNDYSIPGELSAPQVGSDYVPNNQYPPTAGDLAKPYFTYPSTYGHYTSPGLSSYDISPYHTAETPSQLQQQVISTQQPADVSNFSEDDNPPYTYEEAPVQGDTFNGDAYQGDFQLDFDPHSNNDFAFQHNGYDEALAGHVSEEFGENVPGYSQHHKQFVKDSHGVVTKAYGDRLQHFNAGDAADKDMQSAGFQHSFAHGGQYTSIA